MSGVMIVSASGVVSWDHAAGRKRLADEARRVADLLAGATPPASCGDAIPVAPARGAQVAFTPREVVRTKAGNWRDRKAGWQGRDACRRADAFDVMRSQAERAFPGVVKRWKASRVDEGLPIEGRGVYPPVFDPPFTPGQEAAGRAYAALVERVEASGVKCSSLEAQRAGGGGARGLNEAVADDLRRLSALHRRIGDGLAKDVLRPSRGGARSAIRVRGLVDAVCLGGQTLSDVARVNGWGKDGRLIAVLRLSLAAALDRMQGYDLAVPRDGA